MLNETLRLVADKQRRLSRGATLDSIGRTLGIRRYPGELENEFFSRIEGSPGWEALREEFEQVMRLQKIANIKAEIAHNAAQEAKRPLSFLEELKKV